MAELSCRLSPLVYNVLYRRLADDADAHAALEPRLAEIELDLKWLDSAAEAYGRKWSSNVEPLNTGVPADEIQRLEAPHALLASWILTALRRRGSSDEFSAAMRSEILAHLDTDEQDVSELGGREEFSPVIVGWTFGMVVQNDIDLNLPAIPATPIKNKHIAAAYEGLVRHVAALRLEAEPWPDLVGRQPSCVASDWRKRSARKRARRAQRSRRSFANRPGMSHRRSRRHSRTIGIAATSSASETR